MGVVSPSTVSAGGQVCGRQDSSMVVVSSATVSAGGQVYGRGDMRPLLMLILTCDCQPTVLQDKFSRIFYHLSQAWFMYACSPSMLYSGCSLHRSQVFGEHEILSARSRSDF